MKRPPVVISREAKFESDKANDEAQPREKNATPRNYSKRDPEPDVEPEP
jgi:hypothetical protein